MWDGWGGLRLSPEQITVRLFGNPYLVYRGPLEVLTRFDWTGLWQLPQRWFPEDRTWCVSTDIDGFDTYVGGSRTLAERILGAPGLETMRVDPDDLAVVSGEWGISR
jgi:hypothetical protein